MRTVSQSFHSTDTVPYRCTANETLQIIRAQCFANATDISADMCRMGDESDGVAPLFGSASPLSVCPMAHINLFVVV
jgi:hypothetical protein